MAQVALCAFSLRAAASLHGFRAESNFAPGAAKSCSFSKIRILKAHLLALRRLALDTDLVEVTVAKTACGSRSLVFSIRSALWFSVGGPSPSEASWPVPVAEATTRTIAACDPVAKIESEGELRA